MRWWVCLSFLCVAFADPSLAQPLSVDGRPVKMAAAATQKPMVPCQLRHGAGDNAQLASARLSMAANPQADVSLKSLMVALAIQSACTNALYSPQLFNGRPSNG